MSGAVVFVFGLCALSFAAGCGLTAYLLRREPEPVAPPAPPVPDLELRLDIVWPPEDYATKPIHRNPVMGLPVTERPPEPVRPALTLVPDLDPVLNDPEPEPEVAAEPVVVEVPAQPEPVVVELPEPAPEPEPEPVAEVPAQPEPPVVELPDPAEFRQRYLRTFEEARKRSTT
ncbi:hypothetical protein [Saccharothrix variisporea]|uniref:Uncharacterized protein n=1 Tax=Saccharothrix variisporea TaxID=543527 RepID=A0A495XF09_9PSEU|nr:hypothetical protein [Saccharothrix variisporea]RKT72850.1 hypothetical protein DFJ66_6174 [Saccharothrix variisporea]